MGRRPLTHEQFIEKFNKQNKDAQNIEILGTYINSATKILCRCKLDGYEWETTPNILLGGHGCPKCYDNRRGSTLKLTHEQFMKRLYKINSNIEVLGTYTKGTTKIKCRCKICGHEWSPTPSCLLQGHGCPKCAGFEKTTEEFIKQLEKVNSTEIVLGQYTGCRKKILCKCKIDGHIWSPTPHSLLSGTRCPKCAYRELAQNNPMTHERFMKKFYKQNKHSQDIVLLQPYKTNRTKILCKCKVCGYEWEAWPSNLLKGADCPKCARKSAAQKTTKTNEQFMEEMSLKQPDIIVLGAYTGVFDKIKVQCKICGHIWKATPANLLQGSGCPKCKISKGEKRIAQYLDNLGVEYSYDKKYFKDLVSVDGNPLKPDFIIPSLKIWIEFDGQQHFKPVNFSGAMSEQQIQANFKKGQQNDQIKDQYAKDNNWTLIRISFTEYDNIEQILAGYLN